MEEAKKAPQEVNGPLYYVNSIGNRVNRPILDKKMAQEFGYHFLSDAVGTMIVMFKSVKEYYDYWIQNGKSKIENTNSQIVRKEIELLELDGNTHPNARCWNLTSRSDHLNQEFTKL